MLNPIPNEFSRSRFYRLKAISTIYLITILLNHGRKVTESDMKFNDNRKSVEDAVDFSAGNKRLVLV